MTLHPTMKNLFDMTTLLVKQTSQPGPDAKIFRAFKIAWKVDKLKETPLGVSASTTGNEVYGVISCAAKAFKKFTDPTGDVDEIETRVKVLLISDGIWYAGLQPKAKAVPADKPWCQTCQKPHHICKCGEDDANDQAQAQPPERGVER